MTGNVVEVDPAAIVTLAGILAPAGEELKPMVAPPVNAADVSAIVHVEPAVGLIVMGLQLNPFSAGDRIVTVPLEGATLKLLPAPSDATAFDS